MDNPFEIILQRLNEIERMLQALLAARPKPEKDSNGKYWLDLEVSTRSLNAIAKFFRARQYKTKEIIVWEDLPIKELAEYLSEEGLYQIRDVGVQTVTELLKAFREHGIELKKIK